MAPTLGDPWFRVTQHNKTPENVKESTAPGGEQTTFWHKGLRLQFALKKKSIHQTESVFKGSRSVSLSASRCCLTNKGSGG